MKILLFGASGQIGSVIQKVFFENALLQPVFRNDLNLFNYEELERFIIKNKPNIIINCIAFTNVDGCEKDHKTAFKVNADFPKILAKVSSKLGASLIHLSTDYVFNDTGANYLDENTKINPINIYGKSKALGEKNILRFTKQHIILRTSWIYSDLGNNFFLSISDLLKKKSLIHVVNDQFGSPTLAYDLVKGIIDIVHSLYMNKWGIYNLTNAGDVSWYDFACKIADNSSVSSSLKIKPVTSIEYGSLARRPNNSRLDNKKIKETFNIVLPNWETSFNNFIKKIKSSKKI